MENVNTLQLNLGLNKRFRFDSVKPTYFDVKALIYRPLSGGTNNETVDISSVKGMGFTAGLNFYRRISHKDGHDLYVFLSTNYDYSNYTFDLKWEVTKGTSKVQITNQSALLGLMATF